MNLGVWELILIAVIIGMLFGFSKLGNIGPELGKAIKGFRSAMRDDDKAAPGGKATDGDSGSGDEKKS